MLMLIWTLALYGFAALGVATSVFVAGVWMAAWAFAKVEAER